jgi:hypothetical protein
MIPSFADSGMIILCPEVALDAEHTLARYRLCFYQQSIEVGKLSPLSAADFINHTNKCYMFRPLLTFLRH